MRRGVMQPMFGKILAIALLASSAAFAQSLGEVARLNREKQNAEAASAAKPKVITNANLQKDPNPTPGPEAQPAASSNAADSPASDHVLADHGSPEQRSPEKRSADHRFAEQRFAEQRLAEQHAAEQWKRQIQAQENKMTTLQVRIDRFKASIHFVDPGVYPYAGLYNRDQARQSERVAEMQEQLDEQKRNLTEMQEAARRAGMRTAVYDP